MNYTVKNEKETIKIGKKIASKLKGGDILCLFGDLGAGKTTLAKGIASAFGVKKHITSPTFSLMNIYSTKTVALVHIDTYRLKDEQELVDIGIEDYLGAPDTICIIEWPEKMKKLLKKRIRQRQGRIGLGPKIINVKIEHLKNGRLISVA